jgi:tetratricopeptide (TPR) repeat protein
LPCAEQPEVIMNDFFEILHQARAALSAGDYETSRDKYIQAKNLTDDPVNRAMIWAELSWVYYYLHNFQAAVESAAQVLECNPDYLAREDLSRLLGYAYLGLKNNTLAEKYLQQSLEYDSNSDKQQYVKYELGKMLFIQGNYDLAYPYFVDIVQHFKETGPDYYLSVLFYLGFIHYYLKNHTKARENFEQILAQQCSTERQGSAYYGLAFLEFNDRNYLNVISLCEKIISLDRNFFDKETVGFLTAASYYYLGRNDIFVEYYKQMVKSYPQGRYREELNKLSNANSAAGQPQAQGKS